MNIGIMGAGNIGGTMAGTIAKIQDVTCYGIASRELQKAEQFAAKFGVTRAYGSYEEMLADPMIELVYVATPHSQHYENMMLCIEYGKPVLCEKAFTVNAKQAREVLDFAKEKNVFVTEAMWTRYMPMRNTITEVLASKIIGEPTLVTCNLGYPISHVTRLTDPSLAGGALLDLGVYTLNFASMVFGDKVKKISSICTYAKTGVDEQDSITLVYEGGKMAVMNATMLAASDRKGIIYGSLGYIIIENINNFESLTVYNISHEKLAQYTKPEQITGYEYQVMESVKAVKAGKISCSQMPHEETIRIMEIMDQLRSDWGIVYPFEI